MARIQRGDLVDDRAFSYAPGVRLADADSLGHARIASQVCDIAEQSEGGSSVAVFGPWGAGKSSLFGLIAEEAAARQNSANVSLRTVHFDASANAGESFAVNFLSEIGRGLGPRQRALAEQSLFQLRRTLRVPFVPRFLPKWGRALLALFLLLGIFVLAPVGLLAVEDGWLVTPPADPVASSFERIVDWFGVAVGGTLIITVITVLTQLTTVTVEQAAPNQVTQFREIFERTISSANREPTRRVRILNQAHEKLGAAGPKRKALLERLAAVLGIPSQASKRRTLIFIDELDRCTPDDLLAALEGLRAFLGSPGCVFVAAFDREVVGSTLEKRKHRDGITVREAVADADAAAVTETAVDDYFGSAAEFIDKLFQFQFALPPQTRLTFRRFALDLVEGRAGVWEEIARSRGTAVDVVELLTPVHVVSARRTKVLLNAFAVACRDFEDVLPPGEWLRRIEEIAVQVVIETEFPQLATEVRSEPDLLRYIVDPHLEVRRADLESVVRRYRSRTDNDEEYEPMRSYLQRALIAGVALPRPDIILRQSGPLAAAFEDPGLYQAIVRASEMPLGSTLRELRGASPADLATAVDILLRDRERASTSGMRTIALLIGHLVDDELIDPSVTRLELGVLWREVLGRAADWSWGTSGGVKGLLRGAIRGLDARDLSETARRLEDANEEWELAEVVMDDADRVALEEASGPVSAWVSRSLDFKSSVAIRFLARDLPEAHKAFEARLDGSFEMPDGDPVPPASSSTADSRRALAETEQRNEETAQRRAQRRASVRDLIASRDVVEPERWARKLALVSVDEEWASAVLRDAIDDRGDERDWLALEAIASRADLVAELQAPPGGRMTDEALEAARRAGPRGLASLTQNIADVASDDGLAWLAMIAQLMPPLDLEQADALRELAARAHAWPIALQCQLVAVLQLFDVEGPDVARVDLWSPAFLALAMSAGPEDIPRVLRLLQGASDGDRSRIKAGVVAGMGAGHGTSVGVLIALSSALNPRMPSTRHGIPRDALNAALDGELGTSVATAYVQFGPPFRELERRAGVHLAALDDEDWSRYSAAASESSREAAWTALSGSAPRSVLQAISSGGVSRAFYKTHMDRAAAGSNAPTRAELLADFSTLPVSDAGAVQVMAGVRQLARSPWSADVPALRALLRRYARFLTASQRDRIDVLSKRWSKSKARQIRAAAVGR